jgi:hypothetical protein
MVFNRLAVKPGNACIAYSTRSRRRQFVLSSRQRSHPLHAHEACSLHDSGELAALRTSLCRVTRHTRVPSQEYFAFIIKCRIWYDKLPRALHTVTTAEADMSTVGYLEAFCELHRLEAQCLLFLQTSTVLAGTLCIQVLFILLLRPRFTFNL